METMSPIILESERFTLPNDGSFHAINPVSFINPNKTPMLIDEFRFNVPFVRGVSAVVPSFVALARISMGNSQLTNDYVPLPVLAPTYMSFASDSTRVWHLPKPLYVPPHVQVNCEMMIKLPLPSAVLRWSAPGSEFTWTVSVVGRSLPGGQPIPKKIPVPWVCSTSVYSTTNPFTSKDNQIGNPFDSDFAMTQLIGFNTIGNIVGNNLRIVRAPMTIQATYGSGKMLIRDPVPFFSLFPQVRPIMRMRGLMKPKDFLSIVIDVPLTVTDGSALFTSVGMVGYRMLETPKGAAEV